MVVLKPGPSMKDMTEKPKRVFKAPLSWVVDSLNVVALAGWGGVLYLVATTPPESLLATTSTLVLGMEVICAIEVLRMAIGDLPGNLVLGVVLHAIRFLVLLEVLPRTSVENVWLVAAVLGSWAVTEVSRCREQNIRIFPKLGSKLRPDFRCPATPCTS